MMARLKRPVTAGPAEAHAAVDNPILEVPSARARTIRLTPQQLRACFVEARLPSHAMPTLAICEKLLPWLPLGRPKEIQMSGAVMPHDAVSHALALRYTLRGVDAYWRAHAAAAMRDAITAAATAHEATPAEARARAEQVWKEAVFDPLDRLRAALDQCVGLLNPGPEPFPENRARAMDDLRALFTEAMRQAEVTRRFGVSADGPAARFIAAALKVLGYGLITGAAIEKHFSRARP